MKSIKGFIVRNAFSTTTTNILTFGCGRHSCLGRFFLRRSLGDWMSGCWCVVLHYPSPKQAPNQRPGLLSESTCLATFTSWSFLLVAPKKSISQFRDIKMSPWSPHARETIHHQRQIVLRNSSSPESGLALSIRLLWAWRSAGRRPWLRVLPLLSLAFFSIALFTIAGVLSSKISTAGEVLLKGDKCQIPNRTQSSTSKFDTPCPFKEGLCRRENSTIRLDTGHLNSNDIFGLNAPKDETLTFRYVVQVSISLSMSFFPLPTNVSPR